MLIGVSGKIGSGKDLVSKMFQRQFLEKNLGVSTDKLPTLEMLTDDNYQISRIHGLQVAKFAEKLKDFASSITGLPREWFDDGQKKKSLLGPEWNINDVDILKEVQVVDKPMAIRELLIRIGHGCRQVVHPDIWVNALFADYRLKNRTVPTNLPEDALIKKTEQVLKYPDWVISDMRYPNEKDRVEVLRGFTVRVNRPGIELLDHESETLLDNAQFDYYIENDGGLEGLYEKVGKVFDAITAQEQQHN